MDRRVVRELSLLLVTLPPPNFAPPLIAFQQHPWRVVRCWHSNAYSSLFSSLFFFDFHRTNFSRFRRTFHSFDPVGFAIFANPAPTQPNGRRSGSASLPICCRRQKRICVGPIIYLATSCQANFGSSATAGISIPDPSIGPFVLAGDHAWYLFPARAAHADHGCLRQSRAHSPWPRLDGDPRPRHRGTGARH